MPPRIYYTYSMRLSLVQLKIPEHKLAKQEAIVRADLRTCVINVATLVKLVGKYTRMPVAVPAPS